MNIWLVPATDDAATANVPKSLSNPIPRHLLADYGLLSQSDVYAWGARPGQNNTRAVLDRMKKGDVCLFYTRTADGVGRGYHWAGIVDSTRQSPDLSEAIWDTRGFELVYFLSNRWPVTLPKQEINKALGYPEDYHPQGLMRPNIADQQKERILTLLKVPAAKLEQPVLAEKDSTQISAAHNPLEVTERIARFCSARGYRFSRSTIRGFYASLRAKPFVILAGNSGTGKSRLARLFGEAVGANTGNRQFQMISVRPDWNDSSDLLGYFDLNGDYRPGLLIPMLLRADAARDKPFFLCLDEMNLARVEHYFSDFLSIIESRRRENGAVVTDPVIREEHIRQMKRDSLPPDIAAILDSMQRSPRDIGLPPNLYVIGTVNMDETTQPFSRKVLDRANTLEFNEIDLNDGLTNGALETPVPPLNLGSDFLSSEFTSLNDVPVEQRETAVKVAAFLQNLNTSLGLAGFEVGYRVRDEAIAFTIYALGAGMTHEEAEESIVLQKVLPRVQGSSPRIETALISLMKRLAGDEDVPDKEATDFTVRLEQLRVQSRCIACAPQTRGNAAHLSRRRLHLFLARIAMSALRELLRLNIPGTGVFRILGPPPRNRQTAPTQTEVRISGIEDGRAFTVAVFDQGPSSERVLAITPFLFEQTNYQFELGLIDEKAGPIQLRLRGHNLLEGRSPIGGHAAFSLAVNFQSAVGFTEIELWCGNERHFCLRVEVFPSKLDYRLDLAALRADLQMEVRALVYSLHGKTFQTLHRRRGQDPRDIEWLTLLEDAFDQLTKSFDLIARSPLRRVVSREETVPADQPVRSGRAVRNFIRTHAGQCVPSSIGHFRAHGRTWRIEKLPDQRKTLSLDTAENRFIATAVAQMRARVSRILAQLAEVTCDSRFKAWLDFLRKAERTFRRWETRSFLAELPRSADAPRPTLALHLTVGYREFFEANLSLSALLEVGGGALELPEKELSTLYELWCFVALANILRSELKLTPRPPTWLRVEQRRVTLELVKGRTSVLEMERDSGELLRVVYNRFDNTPTGVCRPDNTLEIFKRGTNAGFRYIFDAKYRLQDDSEYLATYHAPGPPPDAIYRMHAYRDQIVAEQSAQSSKS